MTSVKIGRTLSAISMVTLLLAAITPPYALIGSQACALACASATDVVDTADRSVEDVVADVLATLGEGS